MTQTQIDMTTLYNRLSQIGLPQTYVRKLALPDWWDKDFEQTSGSVTEAAAYISRRLNLNFDSLLCQDSLPVFDHAYQPKFKVQKGNHDEQLMVAYALAIRVAEIVAYGTLCPYQPIDQSTVQDIRETITQKYGQVTLEGLLTWCWDRGIPVIHFNEYPSVRKFHGMAAYCHSEETSRHLSRPVIVISLQHLSPSKLLFILAHELGHLFCGHIGSDSFLIDEKVNLSSDDQEETEANKFAVELLTGKADTQYHTPNCLFGPQLVKYAQRVSSENHVAPGVVANNYGWSMEQKNSKCWGAVTQALKALEKGLDAPTVINQFLTQNIEWDRLSDDNQEYLKVALRLASENGV